MEKIKIIKLDESYEEEELENKIFLKKRLIINKEPSIEWKKTAYIEIRGHFSAAGLLPIRFDDNKADLIILTKAEKKAGKSLPKRVDYLIFTIYKEGKEESLKEQIDLIKELVDKVNKS